MFYSLWDVDLWLTFLYGKLMIHRKYNIALRLVSAVSTAFLRIRNTTYLKIHHQNGEQKSPIPENLPQNDENIPNSRDFFFMVVKKKWFCRLVSSLEVSKLRATIINRIDTKNVSIVRSYKANKNQQQQQKQQQHIYVFASLHQLRHISSLRLNAPI